MSRIKSSSETQNQLQLEQLTAIVATLDACIRDTNARLYISGQHAFDESLIFGTRDAYLRLASELLKFLVAAELGETVRTKTAGIPIQTSGSISDAFNSCSEVILDSSDLVETDAQARELFEYFWEQQEQTTSTRHNSDFSKQEFRDCNPTDVKLSNCKITGWKINCAARGDLVAYYQAKSPRIFRELSHKAGACWRHFPKPYL